MGRLQPVISRRELLKGLLAVGAGAVGTALGVQWWPRQRPIGAQLMGPSADRGHRLRSGESFPPPTRTRSVAVAIVGGGVAGLSAGWWLQRQGLTDVEILELEPEVGGNSRSGRNAVSAYPLGAHYLPLPNPDNAPLLTLLTELGVITAYDGVHPPVYREEYLCHEPDERLYRNGIWQSGLVPRLGLTAAEKEQFARFFDFVESLRHTRGNDGKYVLGIPLDSSSTDPQYRAYDGISFGHWLTDQGYTSPALLWYLEYCCRDDYGATLADTSAWAGLHYHASRRAQAANADSDTVLTWPQGNGWLIERLAERLAGHLSPNQLVHSVAQTPGGVELLCQDCTTQETVRILAQAAIVAVPLGVACRICTNYPAGAPRQVRQTPWFVANVTVSRAPQGAGEPLAWDNVSYHSPSLGYVVATHQTLGQYAGPTVLTYYLPLTEQPPTTVRAWAQAQPLAYWQARVLTDLEQIHPGIGQTVTAFEGWLWGHGMVSPTPGYIWGPERQVLIRHTGSIQFAHTDCSGISIFEEGFAQGLRAAQHVMQYANPA